MKLSAVLLLYGLVSLVSGGERPEKTNEYVKATIVPEHTTIKPGNEGALLITLAPADGIHINVDPPVEVRIGKNAPIIPIGNPEFHTDKESGFLATSTSLKQRFSISRSTPPREYTIKGTLVYYFCSDSEGWCRKFSQSITLKLNIVKR